MATSIINSILTSLEEVFSYFDFDTQDESIYEFIEDHCPHVKAFMDKKPIIRE